jgi:hypothetical protein
VSIGNGILTNGMRTWHFTTRYRPARDAVNGSGADLIRVPSLGRRSALDGEVGRAEVACSPPPNQPPVLGRAL